MNPKLLKPVFKIALALATSVLVGTLIKAEKEAGERIDAYFENKEDQDN
jgi:hypothetical protein